MATNKLTAASCNAARLAEGEKEKLIADGSGLFLYVRPSGKSWLFVFTFNGKRKKMALGLFPAVSLADARERAAEARALVAKGIDPVALRDAATTIDTSKTFDQLIKGYLSTLAGRPSYRQAESLLRCHIPQELRNKLAKEITTEDLALLLSKVASAGKKRAAGALRSYLLRMFKMAASRTNPNVPPALQGFGLNGNPASALDTVEGGAGGTCHRALSLAELRDYAKRSTQLLRASVTLDGSNLIIMDGKGRRRQPRVHRLPIPPGSHLARLIGNRTGRLWDIPEAEIEDTQLRVSGLVRSISNDMGGEHFNLRDIRRSVETLLVANGVTLDVTGQVLSHGLGGLQNRSYIRHDFDAEKRRVLAMVEQLLDGTGAVGNVIPMSAHG